MQKSFRAIFLDGFFQLLLLTSLLLTTTCSSQPSAPDLSAEIVGAWAATIDDQPQTWRFTSDGNLILTLGTDPSSGLSITAGYEFEDGDTITISQSDGTVGRRDVQIEGDTLTLTAPDAGDVVVLERVEE